MNVELIRENADGSADYMFNLSPESVAAFARLGIMTALQAAVDGAKRYEPDYEEPPAPDMIEPYVPTVDPKNIYARAAHVGGLGWMLKDAAHYEALIRLVDYVREYERKNVTGEDDDGRC